MRSELISAGEGGFFSEAKLYKNFMIPGHELSNQLDNWLGNAALTYGPARAIIAP